MGKYVLVDGIRLEQVHDETVVTLLSGDIVVLNRTASVALASKLDLVAYSVPEEAKRRVLVVMGQDGLSSRGSSTVLDAAITAAGAINAAAQLGEGAVALESPEAATGLRPDLVVACPGGEGAQRVFSSACSQWAEWGEANGVPVLAEPLAPYGWLDRSPLAIATVGALWLASELYPDICPFEQAGAAAGYWGFMYGLDLSGEDMGLGLSLAEALEADSAAEGSNDGERASDSAVDSDADDALETPSVEVVAAGSIARASARMSSGGGGGGGGGSSSGGSSSSTTSLLNSNFKAILKGHFGFSDSIASLLLTVATALEKLCSSLSKDRNLKASFIFFRTIGAFGYADTYKQTFEWNAVAGNVGAIYAGTILDGSSSGSVRTEEYFFTKVIGLTTSQYKSLRYEVRLQNQICGRTDSKLELEADDYIENKHSYMEAYSLTDLSDSSFESIWASRISKMYRMPDFCHLCITTATALATNLGIASLGNAAIKLLYSKSCTVLGSVDVGREAAAGWLGDAVIAQGEGKATSFGNDDYWSDIDSLRLVYRLRNNGFNVRESFVWLYPKTGICFSRRLNFLVHFSADTAAQAIGGALNLTSSNTIDDLIDTLCSYDPYLRKYNDTIHFLRVLKNPDYEASYKEE